jgi:hypothetical protein
MFSSFVVDLYITPEEYQKSYLGVRQVIATARDGRRVQFSVDILWPYVTHDGVIGSFLIEVDPSNNNKFQSIKKLDSSSD